jgi:hypothetical protein
MKPKQGLLALPAPLSGGFLINLVQDSEKNVKNSIFMSGMRISNAQMDGQMPGLRGMAVVCGRNPVRQTRATGSPGFICFAAKTGPHRRR